MGSLVVEAIVISHLVQRGKQIKLVEMAAVEREDGSHGRAFHRSLAKLDMMAMITMIIMLIVMMMLMKMAGNSIDLQGSN